MLVLTNNAVALMENYCDVMMIDRLEYDDDDDDDTFDYFAYYYWPP